MKREHLYKIRQLMNQAAEALSDEDALKGPELFRPWRPDTEYQINQRIRHGGKLYRVVQDHTSQSDWTPDVSPALYTELANPAEEWPEWKQPLGAQDAYNKGDRVSHNEKRWISDGDGNVWEPGTYGWTETV